MSRLVCTVVFLATVVGCVDDFEPVEEVVCGEPADYLFGLTSIQALEGCTRYRGSIHVSDTELVDLHTLPALTTVDGSFTFFRNDALINLGGLDSLRVVGGRFGLSAHEKLHDIEALSRLRVVGGDFYVLGNFALHNDAAESIVADVAVGGEITIVSNGSR